MTGSPCLPVTRFRILAIYLWLAGRTKSMFFLSYFYGCCPWPWHSSCKENSPSFKVCCWIRRENRVLGSRICRYSSFSLLSYPFFITMLVTVSLFQSTLEQQAGERTHHWNTMCNKEKGRRRISNRWMRFWLLISCKWSMVCLPMWDSRMCVKYSHSLDPISPFILCNIELK